MQWNAAGGGFGPNNAEGAHWQNFNEKAIYLLNEADSEMILAVRRLDCGGCLDFNLPPSLFPLL